MGFECCCRCVSRSRFWGTPIPIWVSEDFQEKVVIGSIEELEKLTGHKVAVSAGFGLCETCLSQKLLQGYTQM